MLPFPILPENWLQVVSEEGGGKEGPKAFVAFRAVCGEFADGPEVFGGLGGGEAARLAGGEGQVIEGGYQDFQAFQTFVEGDRVYAGGGVLAIAIDFEIVVEGDSRAVLEGE